MEPVKVQKLPTEYSLDKELVSLLAEANLKYGEYKSSLKNCQFDSRFFLDSITLSESLKSTQIEGTQISQDDMYYLKYMPKTDDNLEIQNLKEVIEIFESDIFAVTDKECPGNPCYLCARMRRGFLYSKAKSLGCNKIALGHHFNDVIETTLLSMFYGAEIKTMLPKLHSDNFPGLELIRPLYLVKEKDIINWSKSNNLNFLNCACRFTERSRDEKISKRKEIKELIRDMEKINPNIEHNIFKSLDNVNLNCVLSYSKDNQKHSFLDDYDIK